MSSKAPSGSPANPKSPQKEIHSIGPFILGKTLGAGATGKVKLGFHKETALKVAVKIVSKDAISQKPNMRRKLDREIAIMKLIDHPCVLRFLDVYETSRHLFIITEYVEGGELFDYLVRRGFLEPASALKLFQQIILGVEYCHHHMICHRDLKPENILLTADGQVKIADFGMATLMRKNSMLETSCGSPHYASPEVVQGVKYDGRAADLWSCGVILYALLTGKLPFDDDNIRRLLDKVKAGVFMMPQYLHRDIRDLITRMLVIDPQKRMTIAQLKTHVWWLSNPIPSHIPQLNPLDSYPAHSLTEFSDDLIRSMKALGWGNSDDEVRRALMSPERNLTQVFYILMETRMRKASEIVEHQHSHRSSRSKEKQSSAGSGERGSTRRSASTGPTSGSVVSHPASPATASDSGATNHTSGALAASTVDRRAAYVASSQGQASKSVGSMTVSGLSSKKAHPESPSSPSSAGGSSSGSSLNVQSLNNSLQNNSVYSSNQSPSSVVSPTPVPTVGGGAVRLQRRKSAGDSTSMLRRTEVITNAPVVVSMVHGTPRSDVSSAEDLDSARARNRSASAEIDHTVRKDLSDSGSANTPLRPLATNSGGTSTPKEANPTSPSSGSSAVAIANTPSSKDNSSTASVPERTSTSSGRFFFSSLPWFSSSSDKHTRTLLSSKSGHELLAEVQRILVLLKVTFSIKKFLVRAKYSSPDNKSRVKFEMQISDQKLSDLITTQTSISQNNSSSSVHSARSSRASSIVAAESNLSPSVTASSAGGSIRVIEKSISDRSVGSRIIKMTQFENSTSSKELESPRALLRTSFEDGKAASGGASPIPTNSSAGSVVPASLSSSPPRKVPVSSKDVSPTNEKKDKKKEKKEKKEKEKADKEREKQKEKELTNHRRSFSNNASGSTISTGSPRSLSPAPGATSNTASTSTGSSILQRQSSGRTVTLNEPHGRSGSPRRDQSPLKLGPAGRTTSGSMLRNGLTPLSASSSSSTSPAAVSVSPAAAALLSRGSALERLNCITIMMISGDATLYRTLIDRIQAEMKLD